MNHLLYIIIFLIMGCAAHSQYDTVIINTPTTQCDMCHWNIIDALEKVDGVKKVKINDDNQSVAITYLDNKITLNELEVAISKAGYQANDMPAELEAYEKLSLCCRLPNDRK